MPFLKLDRGAEKILQKWNKKERDMLDRYELTRAEFDRDSTSAKLAFKKHQSLSGVYKIKLLGKNDGRRLMLVPDSDKKTYFVYDIVYHDEL